MRRSRPEALPVPEPASAPAAPVGLLARRREQRSLFGEILDWMLAPLLLLWPMSLALTWLAAQGIASLPYDRARTTMMHNDISA